MSEKSHEDQWFNFMQGLADSVIDAPDDEFDEPFEYPENRCNYLCGPHLEQCGRERYHRGDCFCMQRESPLPCIAERARLASIDGVLTEEK